MSKQAVLMVGPQQEGGRHIALFDSTMDCGRHGFDRRHVHQVASGKRLSHRGRFFIYLGPQEELLVRRGLKQLPSGPAQ